tara:strand:+ start:514 stop:990 length:477 start_codon:yes stop_codon:yes gene_type:complete
MEQRPRLRAIDELERTCNLSHFDKTRESVVCNGGGDPRIKKGKYEFLNLRSFGFRREKKTGTTTIFREGRRCCVDEQGRFVCKPGCASTGYFITSKPTAHKHAPPCANSSIGVFQLFFKRADGSKLSCTHKDNKIVCGPPPDVEEGQRPHDHFYVRGR